MDTHRPNPENVYRARLEARQATAARHARADDRLSHARLVLFLVAVGLAWPCLIARSLHWAWLLLPVVAFLVAAVVHDRVIRRRVRAQRAVAFYEDALDRLADRWAGRGTPGDRWADPSHPYADDLDLFGRGSLFELVCSTRTRIGEKTLAGWLTEAAAPEEIGRRQGAVEELRDGIDLREDLAVLGAEVQADDDPDGLIDWASQPPRLAGRWPVAVAGLLGLFNAAAVIRWLSLPGGQIFLLAAAVASGVFVAWFHSRVSRVLHEAGRPQQELALLSGVLARLEAEPFPGAPLRRLGEALATEGQPASRRIARLARLIEINDSRRNMIFLPIASIFLLGTQLAFALERWRAASGRDVGRWVSAVGELEALSSIAALAFERPGDVVPEIVPGEATFEAEALGHPLLAESNCVRNDVRMGPEMRLWIVSGSNMSGKSTLLRTVGINAVLAQVGAPVRARRLRMSPLTVGACMRLRDSLQEGTSRFYAEIKRMRQLVDLADRRPPLLFLLDEILHDTNSNDRRVGAESLIAELLRRKGLGLVTTHDLALAEIVERLGPGANVHFEDQLDGERIVFDYRLRPGIVSKGNALGLMRAVGLRV